MMRKVPERAADRSATHFQLDLHDLVRPLQFRPEPCYWSEGYERLLAAQLRWIESEIRRRYLRLTEQPSQVRDIAVATDGAARTTPKERPRVWWGDLRLSKGYLALQCWRYRAGRFAELRLYRCVNRWLRLRFRLSNVIRAGLALAKRVLPREPAGAQPPAGEEAGVRTAEVSTCQASQVPLVVSFAAAPSIAFAQRMRRAVAVQQGLVVSLREEPFVLGDGMQIARPAMTSILSLARNYLGTRGADQRICIGLASLAQAQATLYGLRGRLRPDDVVVTAGLAGEAVRDWGAHHSLGKGLTLHKRPPAVMLESHSPAEPPGGWPKISIVTVNCNQGQYLEDCLRSVLEQGYPNLEFIVIDGASTDDSQEILQRYRSRVSKMVIEPDDGQSAALNKGFRVATGVIMNWVCSDDMLEPGSLFDVGVAYAQTGADLVVGGCRVIDSAARTKFVHHSALPDEGTLSAGEMMKFMSNWQMGDFFFQPEVFFSRAIWEKAGAAVRKDLFYAMDYDMYIRMGMAGARFCCIPTIVGVSRQHAEQKTQHTTMEYLPQVHGILAGFRDMIAECSRVSCNAGD